MGRDTHHQINPLKSLWLHVVLGGGVSVHQAMSSCSSALPCCLCQLSVA